MNRPLLVQKQLDQLKRRADYLDNVPKAWMDPEYGMLMALIRYVEELEQELAQAREDLQDYTA